MTLAARRSTLHPFQSASPRVPRVPVCVTARQLPRGVTGIRCRPSRSQHGIGLRVDTGGMPPRQDRAPSGGTRPGFMSPVTAAALGWLPARRHRGPSGLLLIPSVTSRPPGRQVVANTERRPHTAIARSARATAAMQSHIPGLARYSWCWRYPGYSCGSERVPTSRHGELGRMTHSWILTDRACHAAPLIGKVAGWSRSKFACTASAITRP